MNIREKLYACIYQGSVEEKLQVAGLLYEWLNSCPRERKDFAKEVVVLKLASEDLALHMTALNLSALCGGCAEKPGGGCCSLFMAGETDAIQLLLNMVAGIDVKRVRENGLECCFLGSRGCIFEFKPMFCLNYNCHAIKQISSRENYEKLIQLSAALLSRQYMVEQRMVSLVMAAPPDWLRDDEPIR